MQTRVPLTRGHEEGDAEFAAEHPRAQVLQGAPVEGQGPAHQHVQHHAEALHPKQTQSATPDGMEIQLWAMHASGTSPQGKYRM